MAGETIDTYQYGTGLIKKIVRDAQNPETIVSWSWQSGYEHMTPEERELAIKTHSIEITVLGMGHPGTDLKINTLGDLHLIPVERPVIALPKPITSYVEVPGYKQREVDMTEALTGNVMYGPREGTLSFYYENLYRHVSKYHAPVVVTYNEGQPNEYKRLEDFHKFTMTDPTYHSITNDEFYYCYKTWKEIYYGLSYFINGRRIQLKLWDIPEFYYTGRLSVTNFKSGQDSFGTVELTYKLDPYRINAITGEQVL